MNVKFILCEAANPLNIGACARAMANFGFYELSLVGVLCGKAEEARKSLIEEAGISAVNSAFILEKALFCDSPEEAIPGCDVLFGTSSLHRQKPDRDVIALPDLSDFILGHGYNSLGILFGSEKRGLTKEQLGFCNYIVDIPTDSRQPSMNLGQAVAVVAYELSKMKHIPIRQRENKCSPPEEISRLAIQIQRTLIDKDGPHWREQTRLREIRQALLDAHMTAQAINALKALLGN